MYLIYTFPDFHIKHDVCHVLKKDLNNTLKFYSQNYVLQHFFHKKVEKLKAASQTNTVMKRMLGGGKIYVSVVPHLFYYNKLHIPGFILLLCGVKIWVRHSPNTFAPSRLQ